MHKDKKYSHQTQLSIVTIFFPNKLHDLLISYNENLNNTLTDRIEPNLKRGVLKEPGYLVF